MNVNKAFFEDLMRDRQLSLRQLAKRLDILPSQLSLTFNGKRRMQITEAVKIAQILGANVNEVMVNAGIEAARQGQARATVIGIMTGSGIVLPNTGTMEKTIAPDGLPDSAQAIQARTADTPFAWTDGWVMFCGDRQPPEAVMGRFCLVKIAGGDLVVSTVRRGYSPGTFNLSGPYVKESQRIEWASPIFLTRH